MGADRPTSAEIESVAVASNHLPAEHDFGGEDQLDELDMMPTDDAKAALAAMARMSSVPLLDDDLGDLDGG